MFYLRSHCIGLPCVRVVRLIVFACVYWTFALFARLLFRNIYIFFLLFILFSYYLIIFYSFSPVFRLPFSMYSALCRLHSVKMTSDGCECVRVERIFIFCRFTATAAADVVVDDGSSCSSMPIHPISTLSLCYIFCNLFFVYFWLMACFWCDCEFISYLLWAFVVARSLPGWRTDMHST